MNRRLVMHLGQEIQIVLVTGATGFVGGAVAQRLRSENCTVRTLVRLKSDTAALTVAGCELCYGDIADAASVREAMEGVDAVVHCAAFASDWGPRETFVRVNVEGSRHVFDAALQCGVKRVVHISTSDLFGIYHDGSVIDDTFPLKETGFPHNDTKIEAEKMALAYAQERGLQVAVISDRTFLPQVVDAMRTHRMIFFGSSRNTTPLCYIDNLVDAVVLALTREKAVGQGFLVGEGVGVIWRKLTGMLADHLDVPKVKWSIPLPLAKAVAVAVQTLTRVKKPTKRPTLTRLSSRSRAETSATAMPRSVANSASHPGSCQKRAS